jgi:hypothetical protein
MPITPCDDNPARALISVPSGPYVVHRQDSHALKTYPTDRTRPVSARPDSSWTPRILCSRMDETSVGEAFASAYVRVWRAETIGAAFRCRDLVSLTENRASRQKRKDKIEQLSSSSRCSPNAHAQPKKSSIELPGRVQGRLRLDPSTGRWD